MDSLLRNLEQNVQHEFSQHQRILSFFDYLKKIQSNPHWQARSASQYLLDTIQHFGQDEKTGVYTIFQNPDGDPRLKIIGHEDVQEAFISVLKSFVREGMSHKLVLLHGPNGTAKSTLIQALFQGLEQYSLRDEGALYRFHWVFPVDRYSKQGLGLSRAHHESNPIESYAYLQEEDITARLPCEMKDHPFLLIPQSMREQFFKDLDLKDVPQYLSRGSLCRKCHQIFESLLTRYQGDLHKVFMHIQVDRFYIHHQYRSSAVTIEPQMHIDAYTRQITADKSLAFLPTSLHYLALYELGGDIPDGNRGVIDYADLLKRPVDTFKYLLQLCEQGVLNVGGSVASLDTVLIGSTNELQLDAFKEFPDFISFKGRMELIRVPYLLKHDQEQQIYDVYLPRILKDKHIAPHTTWAASLWAILTRLKKPNPSRYTATLAEIVSALTPLEKARFYNRMEVPHRLSAEDRKILKANYKRIYEEYSNVPYYEGRLGASAREVKTILYNASQSSDSSCVSPLQLFQELEEFTKRISEYEFLRQDPRDGYHDHAYIIQTVKNEYLQKLDMEVREAVGFFDKNQFEDYIKRYVLHLSHYLKNEKMKNSVTGQQEHPDLGLIDEFETIVGSPTSMKERDSFRQNVLTTLGAYSLDNPGKSVVYRQVFSDFSAKLDSHYFEQKKGLLRSLKDAIELFLSQQEPTNKDSADLAKNTLAQMKNRFGYCDHCAQSAIIYLVKNRY